MGGGSWPRGGNKRLTRLDIVRRREKQRDWETCYRTRKRRILRSNTLDLLDESKESLCGRGTGKAETCVAPADASPDFHLFFYPNEQRGGWGGCAASLFSLVLSSLFSRSRAGLATV